MSLELSAGRVAPTPVFPRHPDHTNDASLSQASCTHNMYNIIIIIIIIIFFFLFFFLLCREGFQPSAEALHDWPNAQPRYSISQRPLQASREISNAVKPGNHSLGRDSLEFQGADD